MREIALDKRLVQCLRITDVAVERSKCFVQKNGTIVRGSSSARRVCGRDLALALSDEPMLNANVLASIGIGPAGNVACGENVGIAGLQPRIDQNSAIQSQPSCLGELKARLDADAHDHKVRVDALAPLQDDLFVFNPSDLRAEVKAHPLSGVSFQDQIGELPRTTRP